MKTGGRAMTLPGWGWTVAGLLFGAFVGFIVTTMAVMVLFRGLWMMGQPSLLLRAAKYLYCDAATGEGA